MRITFFSNFFNSHQLPLALEFNAMQEVDYTFVSLLSVDGIVGRSSLDNEYPFVLKEYENAEASTLAMRHVLEDEIVVFGDMAGKERYVRARAETGKPFFRYAERLLKRGDWWRFALPKIYRTWDRFGRYKNANMRVLCASAYTARDLSMFGFPTDKCLKWGYFPQTQIQDQPTESNNQLPRYKALCSAQRLIPWKRVDLQLHALQRTLAHGFETHLTIAGDGPERAKLEALSQKLGLTDHVTFLGEISHSDVLKLMQDNGIFLATSNRNEGWGATINEAMSMSCCVIASEEMGSVPYLIKDGTNGLSYRDNDVGSLYKKIEIALSFPEFALEYGAKAANDIKGNWSARTAAKRFFVLACDVMGNELFRFPRLPLWDDAPLSGSVHTPN